MSISIEVARRVLEACKQRARELRSPVSIAIVDAGGHLVLFERMMTPYGWATGNISIAKANTAVMFNQPTDAVAQWGGAIPGFAASLSTMTEGKFIMAAGGWPIRQNGVTIGGIGVSGGNAPGRDDEIARYGLAVVENQPQIQQPAYTAYQQQPQAATPASQQSAPLPNYAQVSAYQPVEAQNQNAPKYVEQAPRQEYAQEPPTTNHLPPFNQDDSARAFRTISGKQDAERSGDQE